MLEDSAPAGGGRGAQRRDEDDGANDAGSDAQPAGGSGEYGGGSGTSRRADGDAVRSSNRHVLDDSAPAGGRRGAERRLDGASGTGDGGRPAGDGDERGDGGESSRRAGTKDVQSLGRPEPVENATTAPPDDESDGWQPRGGVRGQRRRTERAPSDAGHVRPDDGATAERGGRPANAAEHAFTPARAFTPAGRGRVSREVAGLDSSLSDAAAPATQRRRGGSRTTAHDRHGDGPAAAAAAAMATAKDQEETAERRRLEREGRVRIAPTDTSTAALRRGIAVGMRMAEMMSRGGNTSERGRRRERRGDG